MNDELTKHKKRGLGVIVACKHTAATLRQMGKEWGFDLEDDVILSTIDRPELRTFEDIVAALPPSTEAIFIDDADQLLPEGKRDPEIVRAFLHDVARRYSYRFHISATYTDNTLQGVSMRMETVQFPYDPQGNC